jgi:molybdate transport system substrate-binding protein
MGAVLLLVVLAASCGSSDSTSVIVLAASSTTNVMQEISSAAEVADPRLDIELVVAGSPSLIAQLESGVEAQILVTADEATMSRAVASGRIFETPVVIATNSLVLALAPGNPGAIAGLADITDSSLLIGACAIDVPCGALAARALGALGLAIEADTEELSVRALATKIKLGEIDAGLVYRTDAETFGLDIIDTADARRLEVYVNEYSLALIGEVPSSQARAVADLLAGDTGRRILENAGFGSMSKP